MLVPDEGEADVVMPRRRLSVAVEEGTVLRVPLEDGVPNWKKAETDPEERARRLADVGRRMDRLRANDPGGDLEL